MSMTREQWRQKLIDSEIPEAVVTTLMASLKDEDLVRMKDMTVEQYLEDVQARLKAVDEEEEEEEEFPPAAKKGDQPTSGISDADISKIVNLVVKRMSARVKDMVGVQEVEIEVPELKDILDMQAEINDKLDAVSVVLKGMTGVLKSTLKGEQDLLEGQFANMSPASRQRLQNSLADVQVAKRAAAFKEQLRKAAITGSHESAGQVVDADDVVMDAGGTRYASVSDMAAGIPIQQ